MSLTRRQTLQVLSATSMGLALQTSAGTQGTQEQTPVPSGASVQPHRPHALVPLTFDPKKLTGISERMIVSHHENNYSGAVKNLNKVREQLAALAADAPGFVVSGLKERELVFRNSAVLHELYFANLGGDGKRAGAIGTALSETWGSAARWEAEFRATAQSLAGGSGWVVLAFDLWSRELRSYWSGNHTQGPAAAYPLLVLDMYEHAYHLDNGAAAAKYIDAFFANVRWEEVDDRFGRALKAAALLGS
jgi:Fe-Mn family superoxide dismutase